MNQRNRFAQVLRGIVLEGTGVAVLIFLFLTMHANADDGTTPDKESGGQEIVSQIEGSAKRLLLDRVSEIFSIGDTPADQRPVPIHQPAWSTWNRSNNSHSEPTSW